MHSLCMAAMHKVLRMSLLACVLLMQHGGVSRGSAVPAAAAAEDPDAHGLIAHTHTHASGVSDAHHPAAFRAFPAPRLAVNISASSPPSYGLTILNTSTAFLVNAGNNISGSYQHGQCLIREHACNMCLPAVPVLSVLSRGEAHLTCVMPYLHMYETCMVPNEPLSVHTAMRVALTTACVVLACIPSSYANVRLFL